MELNGKTILTYWDWSNLTIADILALHEQGVYVVINDGVGTLVF
jgi:hypothetical protein